MILKRLDFLIHNSLSKLLNLIDQNKNELLNRAHLKSIEASPWRQGRGRVVMGHLLYTFDITGLNDQDKTNIKIVLDIENAKCSICLNLWHDVVTVAPCLHNFCNGCFSEWLRRSSANSRDKSQSAACPQCRTAVQSVGRNHFLHNIEEAILQAFSSLQRSDEEIALLESYASVKTNIAWHAFIPFPWSYAGAMILRSTMGINICQRECSTAALYSKEQVP
ncbi:hypothetical protein OsI_35313 [Oryza sativa Indica Group]|uniref:RING-type domain-containing protein n=1 Tax=Oryza sativa subsp. indica TaxID=39946 RepID=B8BJD9_ORYSI|nr:hypothetical protein OsI_35313 [Oryza sativa Indica Group]